MAVGLVIDYMVHIVHYFLHQVRTLYNEHVTAGGRYRFVLSNYSSVCRSTLWMGKFWWKFTSQDLDG